MLEEFGSPQRSSQIIPVGETDRFDLGNNMHESRLAEYEPLWQKDAKDHVIVSLRGCDLKDSVIFNTKARAAVVIEDDAIAVEVMEKMLAHDV